ncbi:hypothetical protein FQR65_LT20465 [Abscondita terminalis]|nr:hypothetical protein FQR65_LT20465 [Abscondita terminalis]
MHPIPKRTGLVIIQNAKAKGYEVLLLDSPIIPHLIQKLESSKENISFARVDADHINNLIKKDEPVIAKLNDTEKETLKKSVEEAVNDQAYTVQLEDLDSDDAPFIITQPEFMAGPQKYNDDTATRKAKGGKGLRELIPDYLTPYLNGVQGLTNNNWYKTIFRDAPVSNTTFNVNGGSDKSRYSFTGSYFNQKGIVIGTDYEKYSSNINLSTDLSDNLKIGVSVTPSYSSGSIFDMVDGRKTYNVVQNGKYHVPFLAPRDSNGNLLISQPDKANTPTDAGIGRKSVAIAERQKENYN